MTRLLWIITIGWVDAFQPRFFAMDGAWLSLAAGEMLSIAMSLYYFVKYRTVWQTPHAAAVSGHG